MQQGYLRIYLLQGLLLLLLKPLSPVLHERNMGEQTDTLLRHSRLVAAGEEVDAEQAEGCDEAQHNAHRDTYRIQGDIEKCRKEPEPEMGEDVHHHIENDR